MLPGTPAPAPAKSRAAPCRAETEKRPNSKVTPNPPTLTPAPTLYTGAGTDPDEVKSTLKRAWLALSLVLLTCIAPRFRRPFPPTYPADFNVYYSAATLVRHGQAAQLYTGADTGTDPQKAIATPDTPIFQAARAQGLSFVGLYVYPPVLADLLLPLTLLPLHTATPVWLAINIAFLFLTAAALARLLGYRVFSPAGALLLVATLCFTPVLQCLVDGQITIFLLLLWAVATLLYRQGHVRTAAALFALATAIKLTPGLVILPFLIWRRWRFVGSFLASLAVLFSASLWIDTPHAWTVFARRVLPAMSGAIPFFTNYSLPAATQRLLTLVRTGAVAPYPSSLPATTVLAGRLASVALLAVLLALLLRTRHSITRSGEVLVLALLGLLAPVLSPVSWFHAYATALVAFAVLWSGCLRHRCSLGYIALLTAVTLLLGSPVSENLVPYLLYTRHAPWLAALLQVGQLLAAAALILHHTWRLGSPTPANEPIQFTA